ncbi:YprA, partial [mine drainage metagenome]
ADLRVGLQVLDCFAGPLGDGGQGTAKAHGEVRVSVLAAMYRKIKLLTHETVGAGPIRVPERDLQTTAYWCSFDSRLTAGLVGGEVGLEAVGHVLGQVACLMAMCDRRDLGVVTQVRASLSAIPARAELVPVAEEFVPGARPLGVGPAGRFMEDPPASSSMTCTPGALASALASSTCTGSCCWRPPP